MKLIKDRRGIVFFGKNFPKNRIPDGNTHLRFRVKSNKPLEIGAIPDSITELIFGESFNQKLTPGVIPSSVTHLTFGSNFNQPLTPGVIPSSVISLYLDCLFNKDLINLSSNLESLTLSKSFNKEIVFPIKLEKLRVYNFGKQELE